MLLCCVFMMCARPVTIQADASSYALGATTMQDGRPISCYALNLLTTCPQNYAQIEKVLSAILFACRRFDQYAASWTCAWTRITSR